MTAIDQQAAESARRITDNPLARAAVAATVEDAARYVAGILAGLTDAANDRGLRVEAGLTTELCRVEEHLTEIAARIAGGDVYSSGLRVAA